MSGEAINIADDVAVDSAIDAAIGSAIDASEDDAVKEAEEATVLDAERSADNATENAVQNSLEDGITNNLTEATDEDVEAEANKAGEEAAEKEASEGGDEAAQDSAKKAAEESVENSAKKSIKDTAKKAVKRLVMAAAVLGLTTLEYLHIKHEHSGCKFPIGCRIPDIKPRAYKGNTKGGKIDKSYLSNCQYNGSVSKCEKEVKHCKSFGGTVVEGSTVAHGVSKSTCDSFYGKYKSCDAECVAENAPHTIADQVRGGISKLFGFTGDVLEWAVRILFIVFVCIILSLVVNIYKDFKN